MVLIINRKVLSLGMMGSEQIGCSIGRQFLALSQHLEIGLLVDRIKV